MLILCLSFAIVLLDQVTKLLVLGNIELGDHIQLLPVFNLSHVRNTGAAWGMMQGAGLWLILLSTVMLVIIIAFRRHFFGDTRFFRAVAGFMIGGIVGNLMDRLRYGFVVDFLDFHWGSSHFPSFNVADSAICIAVGLYLLSQVFGKTAGADGKAEETPPAQTAQSGGAA